MHYIYNILTAGIYIISLIINEVLLTEYVIVLQSMIIYLNIISIKKKLLK